MVLTSPKHCSLLPPQRVLAWDIGGAHLKYAVSDAQQLIAVGAMPTPVWQSPEIITDAMQAVLARWPGAHQHAVTMTAELADAFGNRHQGVDDIVRRVESIVEADNATVYLTNSGELVEASAVRDNFDGVASANWQAMPTFLARQALDGILVDLGSTTCDFVPFTQAGAALGPMNDLERLRHGLLLYTGVARTPVCALATHAEFQGKRHGLAAEHFATSADIYRVLGQLPDNADLLPSADGANKTIEASQQRLARMLCTDAGAHSNADWLDFASHLASVQAEQIVNGFLTASKPIKGANPSLMIGLGVGRFVLEPLANTHDIPYRDGGTLLTNNAALIALAADHAPAAALALLAAQNMTATTEAKTDE